MDKKTIYLPIEIKVRELTSHILISFFAAKKNIEFTWVLNQQ